MKQLISQPYLAILSLAINTLPIGLYANSEVDSLNLATGAQRYDMISNAAISLENPTGVKGVGAQPTFLSLGLSGINDIHLAAALTTNEVAAASRSSVLNERCSEKGLKEISNNSNLQLYALSCKIYEYVNSITGFFTEADQMQKQMIENKATLNQATAENAKRNADIAKEKEKMKVTNKDITNTIKEMDTNKKAVEAATKDVATAEQALQAANAQDCGEDPDGTCSAAKAKAVAEAEKAVSEAKAKLDKAKVKLEKSVAKMINLLIDKLGIETSAVLALMSGTAIGDADGSNVNFKVAGNDFTLVNLNEVFSGLTGNPAEKADQFVDKYSSEKTKDYFTNLITNVETDRNANATMGNKPTNDSSGLFEFFQGQYIQHKSPDQATTKEVLTTFAKASNGTDFIETLSLAVSDYTNDKSSHLIEKYEGLKTPESRINSMQQKNEEFAKQLEDVKKMITLNLTQLDKTLELYKSSYKSTVVESTNANMKDSIFYKYVNNFVTTKLKQKLNEGYFSKVNYKGIQVEFTCFVKGGTEASCKKQVEEDQAKNSGEKCNWMGAVFGPSQPPKDVCDKTKIGQVLSGPEIGGTLTCQCN